MSNRSSLVHAHRLQLTVLLLSAVMLASLHTLMASDSSDAAALRDRCEKESRVLEIAVRNYGEENDIADYENGIRLIKTGKLKIAQSQFPDAIAQYNEYLKSQHRIYIRVSAIYISRTEELYNDVAAELVDSIDNEKVEQYLKLANRNLADAKSNRLGGNHRLAIDLCRTAKKYALDCYTAINKEIPGKYRKDRKDINREIYNED